MCEVLQKEKEEEIQRLLDTFHSASKRDLKRICEILYEENAALKEEKKEQKESDVALRSLLLLKIESLRQEHNGTNVKHGKDNDRLLKQLQKHKDGNSRLRQEVHVIKQDLESYKNASQKHKETNASLRALNEDLMKSVAYMKQWKSERAKEYADRERLLAKQEAMLKESGERNANTAVLLKNQELAMNVMNQKLQKLAFENSVLEKQFKSLGTQHLLTVIKERDDMIKERDEAVKKRDDLIKQRNKLTQEKK